MHHDDLQQRRLTIIGAGTMGQTIATRLVQSGLMPATSITVTDRSHTMAESLARDLGVRVEERNDAACQEADIIILCVKPNDVAATLQGLREHKALWPRTLLISIAAGVTIAQLEQYAGAMLPIIRVMPNTPCLVGQGMTVLSPGSHATGEHLDMTQAIFATLGRTLTLDEKHMDVVTALSGSGPAFIYVMLESLADGAVMRGLPRATATELIAQVALGSATMLLSTGRHPSALKDDVTTPGGCTIAGLLAMEDGKIRSTLARTIEKAAETARQLGQVSAA